MFGRICQDIQIQKTISLKVSGFSLSVKYLEIQSFLSFSDIFLSIVFIPRRRPIRWINRQGFTTRKNVILQWLFVGNVLILGYKSTLLSTLIPIRYESTIDTLQDMAESGLPFTIPRATTFQKLIATDPRPSVMSIYMKRKEIPLVRNSTIQEKLDKMYF